MYESEISLRDRESLPLNGPGNYRVRDGVVWTRAVEINAVRHCNLSCRGCSHSAPLETPYILQPEEIFNSLTELSKFLKAETVRIVGGEPLLHPDLQSLFCAVRKAGIAEKICIITNGILLDQLDETILSEMDEIHISLYPISTQLVNRIYKNAERISKICKVKILKYYSFRESIARSPISDQGLCENIYETCQIAHFWRCITIDQGFLYRCPQSMVLMRRQRLKETVDDRLEINAINGIRDILNYLENNNPLTSCAWCLGSVGSRFMHEQIHKNSWENLLPENAETAIDYEFMKCLQKNARSDNYCMKVDKGEKGR